MLSEIVICILVTKNQIIGSSKKHTKTISIVDNTQHERQNNITSEFLEEEKTTITTDDDSQFIESIEIGLLKLYNA